MASQQLKNVNLLTLHTKPALCSSLMHLILLSLKPREGNNLVLSVDLWKEKQKFMSKVLSISGPKACYCFWNKNLNQAISRLRFTIWHFQYRLQGDQSYAAQGRVGVRVPNREEPNWLFSGTPNYFEFKIKWVIDKILCLSYLK